MPRKSPVRALTEVELLAEFPEHDRLAPYSETNWAIREFFNYLMQSGCKILFHRNSEVQVMHTDSLEEKILQWHGVDPVRYAKETHELIKKYGDLISKTMPQVRRVPSIISLKQACMYGIVPRTYTAARKRIARAERDGLYAPLPIDPTAGVYRYKTDELIEWVNSWGVESEAEGEEVQLEIDQITDPLPRSDGRGGISDGDPFARLMEQIKGRQDDE